MKDKQALVCAEDPRTDSDDYRFMARAFELARRAYYSARPNPRVGCVLAKDSRIIGEGFHYRAGEAHAEVNALREAGDAARGGTAYTTLEPCSHQGRTPPCSSALIEAGVARVVYAVGDPDPRVAGRGAHQLRAAGIRVSDSIMAEEAVTLNRGFFRRMRDRVPMVRVKIGMTLDAKIALQNGASQWITSAEARADGQRLRAESGAILTGVGTVIADDPALTVRDDRFDLGGRQPLRVVLDTNLRVPPSSRVFREAGETRVLSVIDQGGAADALRTVGASVKRCPESPEGLNLEAVLRHLGECEINDVLVEAGPTVVSAFLQGGLCDELIVYTAPRIFGDSARDSFRLPPPVGLNTAAALEFVDSRRVGPDLRITLKPRV
ncbi:MAG: bifunctional diaminohydroxyphosphoribosylaminopyrimidine deaminase/5-amino-6-(5-phosphoribosylamino)uracil reductase RibD [Gammaproteobacteria bacterium]|jgi:diaminohydroxyphosphoribosylaminopyrimidine deaminase/5-amino-6-(5-phosphoribosylamino)uracil reductase|nr:bifunctional diaminohydroxyphosphoribosylaminopyrimidine deaminase/5-amino-6-(5-phosphoribosylamino)uracil reductase RibD [Gammaproteobacteria bacterium]HJP37159.1 bifunctional diaminohydroxyphosphoribosylaminopyrimidine deaminase/5-amino-6-(5-phosphoribosylamino)uracil reductase RibD [Gammaproteobacteria bacterium]